MLNGSNNDIRHSDALNAATHQSESFLLAEISPPIASHALDQGMSVVAPLTPPMGCLSANLLSISIDANLSISSFLATTMNLTAFHNLLANQCNVIVTVSENIAEAKVNVGISGGILETRLALKMFHDKVMKSV